MGGRQLQMHPETWWGGSLGGGRTKGRPRLGSVQGVHWVGLEGGKDLGGIWVGPRGNRCMCRCPGMQNWLPEAVWGRGRVRWDEWHV